eukprot:5850681-Amphidinium_carterae.1
MFRSTTHRISERKTVQRFGTCIRCHERHRTTQNSASQDTQLRAPQRDTSVTQPTPHARWKMPLAVTKSVWIQGAT